MNATPLLLTAQFSSTRTIRGAGNASTRVHGYDDTKYQYKITWRPFSVLALAVVALLALRIAMVWQREQAWAREAEVEREELREFMGLVVHDLRGPLTVAIGYLQLLHRQLVASASGAAHGAIDRIDRALHQMDRLVSELLDSTRIGGGRFVVHPVPTNLAELARTVVEEARAGNADRVITLETPPDLGGMWNPDRLCQVLTNLITNAIKYSPGGRDVIVTVRPVGGLVQISVTDHGSGIAPDQIDRIFQPFTRAGRERDATGTGLGLCIAKGIVEAHGGRIWAESPVGVGSTFHVELPRGPASQTTARPPAPLDRSPSDRPG